MTLRNPLDYGRFSAKLEDTKGNSLGNCIVEVSIDGFGTEYKIFYDKKIIFNQTDYGFSDDEEDVIDMIFTKDYWQFYSFYHTTNVRILLPFNKCLI